MHWKQPFENFKFNFAKMDHIDFIFAIVFHICLMLHWWWKLGMYQIVVSDYSAEYEYE